MVLLASCYLSHTSPSPTIFFWSGIQKQFQLSLDALTLASTAKCLRVPCHPDVDAQTPNCRSTLARDLVGHRTVPAQHTSPRYMEGDARLWGAKRPGWDNFCDGG